MSCRRRQFLALGLAPQLAEADRLCCTVVGLAYQRGDRGADLDADRVLRRREDAGVGVAVGRGLAGLVLVAVETVDADGVERLQVALPHAGEGQPVQPRVVGDEADDAAPRLLGDAALGHAEEADVEVVEALALGPPHPFGRAVGGRKPALLVHGHAREAVVGRVAENHQDGLLLLHLLGAVAFLLQLREGERLLHGRLPAGEGVGEEDARAFVPVVG